jgi:hypothetical protein
MSSLKGQKYQALVHVTSRMIRMEQSHTYESVSKISHKKESGDPGSTHLVQKIPELCNLSQLPGHLGGFRGQPASYQAFRSL